MSELTMNRKEMLNKLSEINFRFIDPPSEWKDIGFTERPIWVNSKGYGYIACDEPIYCWEGKGISKEKWAIIREKIQGRTLNIDDIKDTSIYDLLDDWKYPIEDNIDDFDEEYTLSDALSNIINLQNDEIKKLFCMETIDDGLIFFDSETDFKKAYERDWCDYSWNELDDLTLEEWIKRLF